MEGVEGDDGIERSPAGIPVLERGRNDVDLGERRKLPPRELREVRAQLDGEDREAALGEGTASAGRCRNRSRARARPAPDEQARRDRRRPRRERRDARRRNPRGLSNVARRCAAGRPLPCWRCRITPPTRPVACRRDAHDPRGHDVLHLRRAGRPRGRNRWLLRRRHALPLGVPPHDRGTSAAAADVRQGRVLLGRLLPAQLSDGDAAAGHAVDRPLAVRRRLDAGPHHYSEPGRRAGRVPGRARDRLGLRRHLHGQVVRLLVRRPAQGAAAAGTRRAALRRGGESVPTGRSGQYGRDSGDPVAAAEHRGRGLGDVRDRARPP